MRLAVSYVLGGVVVFIAVLFSPKVLVVQRALTLVGMSAATLYAITSTMLLVFLLVERDRSFRNNNLATIVLGFLIFMAMIEGVLCTVMRLCMQYHINPTLVLQTVMSPALLGVLAFSVTFLGFELIESKDGVVEDAPAENIEE